MAMTILAAMSEQGGNDFQNRIGYLMVKAAVNILAEDPATQLHAARAALATKIIANPRQYIEAFSRLTVTNLDLTTLTTLASVADTNLQTALNGVYNLLT